MRITASLTPTPVPRPAIAATDTEVHPLPDGDSVAWSDFALGRHKPGTGYSYFTGSQAELIQLIQENWDQRIPGQGRKDLTEVVIVPMPSERFMTTTVPVTDETELQAQNFRRREHEAPYVRVTAKGQAQPAQFAKVVCYSHATLAKNQESSRPSDWEIVTIIASPVENEPMDPQTMMRNMRGQAGGTQVNYSAEELLDSIDFWSRHVKVF